MMLLRNDVMFAKSICEANIISKGNIIFAENTICKANIIQKTPFAFGKRGFLLAEDEGFEPPQTESESGVLPLHKSSVRGTVVLYPIFGKCQGDFLIFCFFFSWVGMSTVGTDLPGGPQPFGN